MVMAIVDFYYTTVIKILGSLPDIQPFEVPDGVTEGVNNVFALLGFIAPYSLYKPLITFILALTVFRIAWAVFLLFKR